MHRIGWTFLILLWRASIAGTVGETKTPSFDVEVPLAPTPVRSDGRSLLAYEIHLTNFADETLTLTKIDARDAASGRPVRLTPRMREAWAPYAGEPIVYGHRR